MPYAPTGLPKEYEVVSTRDETPTEFEDEKQKKERAEAMKGALAVTGWRRWLYRVFLATTAMLLSSQFYLDSECRCSLHQQLLARRIRH